MFKSGTDLYNSDLDNQDDTVFFYNCSTLGYDATYNIPNTDTSLSVSACKYGLLPSGLMPFALYSMYVAFRFTSQVHVAGIESMNIVCGTSAKSFLTGPTPDLPADADHHKPRALLC